MVLVVLCLLHILVAILSYHVCPVVHGGLRHVATAERVSPNPVALDAFGVARALAHGAVALAKHRQIVGGSGRFGQVLGNLCGDRVGLGERPRVRFGLEVGPPFFVVARRSVGEPGIHLGEARGEARERGAHLGERRIALVLDQRTSYATPEEQGLQVSGTPA